MKKREFELSLHVGVQPIQFGMKKEDVRSAMNEGGLKISDQSDESYLIRDYFYNSSILVDYANGTVTQIVFAPVKNLILFYKGKDLLDMPSKNAYNHILKGEMEFTPQYSDMKVVFPEQRIILMDAARQYDAKRVLKRKVYAAVCIADERYLETLKS